MTLKELETKFPQTPFFEEISKYFKDPTPYLPFFYQACLDALQKKEPNKLMKEALQGRIFTLKNALIAQDKPDLIRKSQTFQQSIEDIKQEGAAFIHTCLLLYLENQPEMNLSSFKEQLINIAKQLLPFTSEITKMYLSENRKGINGDPFTYRNPSGYNQHGLVAATILEACLKALGFNTRLMSRMDLEPRITLATAHNVIEVCGPNQTKFLLDPCHIQFLKDIYIDDQKLPQDPLLVLQENQIEDFIETRIIKIWKQILLVQKGDTETVKKLEKKDQILAHTLTAMEGVKDLIHECQEDLVKKAFKRVWGLSTYHPILCDIGFQELFHGYQRCKTHDTIKHMEIGNLTNHPSIQMVTTQLQAPHSPKEALSLISKLPRIERNKHFSSLGTLPNIKNVNASLIAYVCTLKKIVNPNDAPLRVVYGCSGADCTSVLLATNANELIFIDQTNLKINDFYNALPLLLDSKYQPTVLQEDSSFIKTRNDYLGQQSQFDGKTHTMPEFAIKLLFDLKELGVNLNQIKFCSKGNAIQLEFPWRYWETADEAQRTLTIYSADLTQPENYPVSLKEELEKGIDIFYMKVAFEAPFHYPRFLPLMAANLKKGGWLMTADKTFSMDEYDPEACLKEQHTFTLKTNDEKMQIEEFIYPPLDPLTNVPSLSFFPKRYMRNSGTDLSYWTILNLRQKES